MRSVVGTVIEVARTGMAAAAILGAVACNGGFEDEMAPQGEARSPALALEAKISAYVNANQQVPGLVVAVAGPDESLRFSSAAGSASPDERLLTAATPVRLASVTKTYVAATVLKLQAQGMIDLDAPLSGLIDAEFDSLLKQDGYDTRAITPRHLLMHVSGMPDHADDTYLGMVLEDTSRQWTRTDQVALLIEGHDPLGPPGQQYKYSDTGYVLLGHIVERVTGETLSAVVRREMKFDELGLATTWWEQVEVPPDGVAARAHQYVDGMDTTEWNGSLDLHGGGGLIASTEDMAMFMVALMRGEVFDKAETLEEMKTAPGHPFPERYRIGLFPGETAGYETYSHGGFWGTYAVFVPELDIAIAGTVLEQSGYRDLVGIINETIEEIAETG